MAYVLGKTVELYTYLNDEASGKSCWWGSKKTVYTFHFEKIVPFAIWRNRTTCDFATYTARNCTRIDWSRAVKCAARIRSYTHSMRFWIQHVGYIYICRMCCMRGKRCTHAGWHFELGLVHRASSSSGVLFEHLPQKAAANCVTWDLC